LKARLTRSRASGRSARRGNLRSAWVWPCGTGRRHIRRRVRRTLRSSGSACGSCSGRRREGSEALRVFRAGRGKSPSLTSTASRARARDPRRHRAAFWKRASRVEDRVAPLVAGDVSIASAKPASASAYAAPRVSNFTHAGPLSHRVALWCQSVPRPSRAYGAGPNRGEAAGAHSAAAAAQRVGNVALPISRRHSRDLLKWT
jgi:hypothetical protein